MAIAVFTRQAALGPVGAQTNRGERALDGVGRAYMLPVLGGEVVESIRQD